VKGIAAMQIEVIDPARTAMIVVDMQNDFVAAGAAMETPAARALVPKLAEALDVCQTVNIRVIYTTHVHRRDGSDMGLFDDMHPSIANRAALVDGTPGVSGTTTENCCHATARDAMFRNYRVLFLSDATATYDYPDRGFGPMPNAQVHHATSVILAA
jgi:ureidoacrylate peracid hydrolase